MANLVNFSTYGFLDDILALNEDNWRNFFKPIVYDSVQSGLEVTAGTGMTVNVSTGECRCGSIMGISNSQMLLDVNVGDNTYNRIDSVVIQYTYGDPSTLSVAILEGEPSASPVPPTLTKSYNNLWQMEIAQILVPVNATTASECTITDKRIIYNSLDSIVDPINEDIDNINKNKADNGAVAPVFSETATYAVDACVMYQGKLYKFLSAHNPGPWIGGNEVVETNALAQSGGGGGSGGVGDEITFNDNNSAMIITSSNRSINSLESAIAIISSGDTHPAINAGQYVYIKLHSNISGIADLPEGLYVAKSSISANTALTTSNVSSVNGGGLNSIQVLVVDCGTISSIPKTINTGSALNVESDMVVLQSTFGNPSAVTSNWTISTYNGYLIVGSGTGETINGSTTLKLYLMKSR